MASNTALTKHEVFDFMINNDLESARFLKNPKSDKKVVVEVFEDNDDYKWQEVWDNERVGSFSFPLKYKDTFLPVGDDDSSENYHTERNNI